MTDTDKIIIGNGEYARMMKRYLQLYGQSVIAYSADGEYVTSRFLDNIPVLTFKEMRQKYSPASVQLVMGIGYRNMGNIRKKIYMQCKDAEYSFINYIHPTAIIEKNAVIGEANNILEGVILEESVSIGNANLLFGGSLIAHGSSLEDYNTLSVRAVVAGGTKIGNNCFLGASSVVKDHIYIEDYGLVGAGAYVSVPIKKYQVVVPSRASILKKRSTDFI